MKRAPEAVCRVWIPSPISTSGAGLSPPASGAHWRGNFGGRVLFTVPTAWSVLVHILRLPGYFRPTRGVSTILVGFATPIHKFFS